MNNIPNLTTFLEFIDPKDSLNKVKILSDFYVLSTLVAAKKCQSSLSEQGRKKLDDIILRTAELNVDDIIKIFVYEHKNGELLVEIDAIIPSLTLDYIRKLSASLPDTAKAAVFKKWAELAK